MSNLSFSVTVDAPIDRVFSAATNLHSWPERISQIVSIEILTDGPVGEGTRFRETRVMFGREATEEMQITEWTPPEGYTLEAESNGMHYTSRYTFVSTDVGATEVTLTFGGQPLNWIAKIFGAIMMPLVKKSLVKCIQQDLQELKEGIEREQVNQPIDA